jgi:hypothetical protein
VDLLQRTPHLLIINLGARKSNSMFPSLVAIRHEKLSCYVGI